MLGFLRSCSGRGSVCSICKKRDYNSQIVVPAVACSYVLAPRRRSCMCSCYCPSKFFPDRGRQERHKWGEDAAAQVRAIRRGQTEEAGIYVTGGVYMFSATFFFRGWEAGVYVLGVWGDGGDGRSAFMCSGSGVTAGMGGRRLCVGSLGFCTITM